MKRKPERLDLEVVGIRQVEVPADAVGETVISIEVVGGQILDLHLTPHASAALEAFMVRASVEQAKLAPKQ